MMENAGKEKQLLCGYYLIELLSAALAERMPLQKPANLTWAEIHRMAKRHSVEAIAYESAVKIAGPDEMELMKMWQEHSLKCIMQGKVQLAERAKISGAFTEAGIRLLPLKGWFLKGMYPNPEWRQMADLDILIDKEQAENAKNTMEKLGYEVESFDSGNHDVYTKNPWIHVELHRELLQSGIKGTV